MKDRERYYIDILNKQVNQAGGFDFGAPASAVIEEFSDVAHETFLSVTALVTAPVLTSYIVWILHDAINRKIEALLFMARDGYVMFRIAKTLCEIWGLNIECRYFYASRQSLRLPLYAIDKAHALEKHCDPNSENKTVMDILTAAGLTPNEIEDILNEITLDGNIKEQLTNSELFDKYAFRAASEALIGAKGYFTQNVQLDPRAFALVDSGWSGSIQESFGKLYQSFTNKPANLIRGYYFGLISHPPPQSGIYHSYFFSPKDGLIRFKNFSIDLFECLCAAQGGRTLTYSIKNGTWHPVFAAETYTSKQHWDATKQIEMCESYANYFVQHNNIVNITVLPDMRPLVSKLLKSFMQKPTFNEAQVFGGITFSRGVLENSMSSLARELSHGEIKQYTLTGRLWNKLAKRKKTIENPVFWLQGALALTNVSWIKKFDVNMMLLVYWLKIRLQAHIIRRKI